MARCTTYTGFLDETCGLPIECGSEQFLESPECGFVFLTLLEEGVREWWGIRGCGICRYKAKKNIFVPSCISVSTDLPIALASPQLSQP